MVVRKAKKVTKYRGSNTHGGGSMKKRRGAGHRGGRGRAGSGKRGDGKKPSYWKEAKRNKGFVSKGFTRPKTINIGHLNNIIDTLVLENKATFNNGTYSINLADIKINKLLGSGILTKKLIITVNETTEKAINKVESNEGKIILPE